MKGKQASSKSTAFKTQQRQSKAKITIERSGKTEPNYEQLSVLQRPSQEQIAPPVIYTSIAVAPIKADPPGSDVKASVPADRGIAIDQVINDSLVDRLIKSGVMAPDPNDEPHRVVTAFLKPTAEEVIPPPEEKVVAERAQVLIPPTSGIPPWGHTYIYSRDELRSAKPDQKKFYQYYKNRFYAGEFIEVGEDTNYGFILYFDLIHEYKTHLDLDLLEKQFGQLDKSCPKTHSYSQSFLIAKMREFGDEEGLARLGYVEHWRTRYEKQLKLSKSDQKYYDAIYLSGNSFINIDQCGLETLRLYIRSIGILKAQYKLAGATMGDSFHLILDLIARKENRYHLNSPNYKYTVEKSNQLYQIILHYCENQLRDIYRHKRKINLVSDYHHKEVIDFINDHLIRYLESGKLELIKDIPAPLEATIIALNAVNITRWKEHIELTEAHFTSVGKTAFLQQVEQVIMENRDNPSLETIFLELSKFLAPLDKITRLQYHLRYVLQNALAKKLVLKPVSKLVQKTVFETATQYQRFEAIVKKLGETMDLDTAMVAVSAIYTPVRKKILLDTEAIRQVVAEHSETVEVLNEYLKDEEDVIQAQTVPHLTGPGSIETKKIGTEKTETEKTDTPAYKQEVIASLNQTGLQLLELFRSNNLQLSAIRINDFCRDNGLMKGALIDSVNEQLYELIDDVLIDETMDEGYAVNPEYFQLLVI
ncbi:tellurite resistance TerB C-terminal domain-containing protein [Mucilaginibacter sp.]|uniref:tellurite resistance TerB C-terminal domain-containing protein n=1 Tax=Mucilaginibacter sp. TaxID=1882438 RepID=UPI003564AB24